MRRAAGLILLLVPVLVVAALLHRGGERVASELPSGAADTRVERAAGPAQRAHDAGPAADERGSDGPSAATLRVHVSVIDSRGAPVASAVVTIDFEAATARAGPALSAVGAPSDAPASPTNVATDARGDATIPVAAAGRHTLRVSARGLASRAAEVDVVAGRPAPRVAFVLPPGHAMTGLVRRPDGTPLPGTLLEAWPRDVFGQPHARTRAGPDGRYALDGLAAGGARIVATEPGAFAVEAGTFLVPDVAQRDIVIAEPAVVAGQVTAGDGRAPVRDVEIELSLTQWSSPGPRARTDENGRYRIAGVPPGCGVHARCVTAGWWQPPFADWTLVTNPGATTVADVHLTALRGTLRVRVRDACGAPVPGAALRVLPDIAGGAAKADDRGDHDFTGLAGGPYAVLASAPGLVAAPPLDDLASATTAWLVRQLVQRAADCGSAVTVPTDGLAELTVTLRPGLTVRGIVADGDGRPAAGAEVRDAGGTAACVSDADGSFELTGVIPGRAVVLAATRGPETARLGPFAAESGDTIRDVRIVLALPLTITGRVVGANDAPVAGTLLRAATDGPDERLDMDEWPRVSAQPVRADGTFEVTVRRDTGWFRLRAEAPGRVPAETDVMAVPDGPRVDAGTLRLGDPAVLAGRVLDVDGRPIADAEIVSVWPGSGPGVCAVTGPDGSFRVLVHPSDEQSLNVRHAAFAPAYRHGKLIGDRLEIRLEREFATEIRVVDANRAPVAAAVVTIAGAAQAPSTTVRTDGDGRVTLRRPAGEFTASVGAQAVGAVAVQAAAVRFTIPGPAVELRAVPAAVIVGRLRNERGQPVGDVYVVAARAGAERGIASDPEGSFAIAVEEQGSTWDVTAGRWGTRFPPATVAGVVAGGAPVALTLRRAPDVRIRFVDEQGASVRLDSLARVSLASVSTPDEQTSANCNGGDVVVLPGAPVGEADLVVEFSGDSDYLDVEQRVTSPPPGDVVVVLRRGAVIEGILVDGDGHPVGDATVTCFPEGDAVLDDAWAAGMGQGYTDFAGRFRVGALRPGTQYTVVAEADAPLGIDVRAEVAADTSGLRLVVRAGRELRGRVADSSGRPAGEVTIVALDAAGAPRAWASTLDDGRFEMHGVPPGFIRLVARTARLPAGVGLAEHPADASEVTITLPPAVHTGD